MTDPHERVAAYPADHPRAYRSILALMLPDETGTLRATYSRQTVEEMTAQEGHPVRVMTWNEWKAAAARAQDTPVQWCPCSAREYQRMLEVLPPVAWASGSFCVGEPSDHEFASGRPRYEAYRQRGTAPFLRWDRSTRAVTVRELSANRHTPSNQEWTK